ncbi:MAG: radical SAM protein [Kiritimatiellae bacterium]|nr:radical SAM protein [Kiritimatiellia bacterium]
MQVELTNHCNYRCRFCPQSRWRQQASGAPYNRAKGYMDFDLYRRIIDEANQVALGVNFSFFGEPMMHPRFLDCMEYLNGRNPALRVVMNTNLSLATQEIFTKLIEIRLDNLRLSIDAATPETYETVRPGGRPVDLAGREVDGNRFEAVCRKAEWWFSLCEHTPTRHVFTVNSCNRHEVKAFVERWLPLLGENDAVLTKSVLSYGGKVFDDLVRPNPCNVWDAGGLTVDWAGNVSPCNLDTNMDLAIGNVEQSTLKTLRESPRYRELRRASNKGDIAACWACVDANDWRRNLVFRRGDCVSEDAFYIHD